MNQFSVGEIAIVKDTCPAVVQRGGALTHIKTGFTVAERVEATLYGDVQHRDADFLSIAAEVLHMSQADVDAAVSAQNSPATLDAQIGVECEATNPPRPTGFVVLVEKRTVGVLSIQQVREALARYERLRAESYLCNFVADLRGASGAGNVIAAWVVVVCVVVALTIVWGLT